MHERGRLQKLACVIIRHLCTDELVRFVLNQWEQLLGGGMIGGWRAFEDARHIAHVWL